MVELIKNKQNLELTKYKKQNIMEFTQKLEKGQDSINGMIERAWQDENFKNKFINSPQETIEEFTGKNFNLKENMTISVEDQTDSDVVYLNIPRKVELEDLELTDEELETVAGGDFGISLLAGLACYAIIEIAEGIYEGCTN